MGKLLELRDTVCAPSRPQPCSPGHRSPPPHPAPLHEATCLALVPPASSPLPPTCPWAQPNGHLQPSFPIRDIIPFQAISCHYPPPGVSSFVYITAMHPSNSAQFKPPEAFPDLQSWMRCLFCRTRAPMFTSTLSHITQQGL